MKTAPFHLPVRAEEEAGGGVGAEAREEEGHLPPEGAKAKQQKKKA